jgi:CheY-like chemotaxis protein
MSPSGVEILLVEDNPADAELTLRALRKQNLANPVHHARDGAEALDFIFATGAYADRAGEPLPKVVLLDVDLPRVDGIEVPRRLRSDPRTATLLVLVMTSSLEERDVVEGYALGVNGYVAKPVEFAPFAEAVSRLGLYWLLLDRPPTSS